ncbi:MAG TPA: CHAT domain-containing protein [Saprospiraceae bacterium]|nr:CHAT domain-containing protein [Saprospiraceae bacterium]HPI08561.1 CHAT domain-containing protein [Saprospiraceae bacterium]
MRGSSLKYLVAFFWLAVVFPCPAQTTTYKVVFDSLFRNNLVDEALAFSEKLELEQMKSGPSLDLAFAVNRKGFAWYRKGDWPQADSLFREAVEIAAASGNSESMEFTDFLNSLGGHAGRMGNFEESLEIFNRILQIRTKLLGENDPAIVRVRSSIGLTYYNMGQFNNALNMALGSIGMYERNGWKEDYQYMILQRDAGGALSELGRFSESKQHYQKALSLARDLLGEEHNDYVRLLYNYCYSLNQSGDYTELEPTATHLVSLLRKIPNGDRSGTMQLALNILGTTKYMIGLYPDAIQILKKAKEVAEVCCGAGLVERAEVCDNLAQAYIFSGQLDSAYLQVQESTQIGLEKQAMGVPVDMVQKADRAVILIELHKYPEAKTLLAEIEQSVVWNDENKVGLRPKYLMAKWKLLAQEGDFSTAISLLDEHIQNTRSVRGEFSWDLIALLTEKSRLHLLTGNDVASLAAMTDMLALKYLLVFSQMALLSDNERNNLAAQFSMESSILGAIAQRRPDLTAAQQLVDLQLFKKSILEKTSRKIASIVQETDNLEIKEIYRQWIDAREQYYFAIQTPEPPGSEIIREPLYAKAELLEKTLVWKGLENVLPEKIVTAAYISAALQPGEAAVDVLQFRRIDQFEYSDSIVYAFSIIRPGTARPEIVFLPNGNELESFVMGQYQNEISRKKDISPIIYEKMWAPVAAHLEGIRTVYFSPDGIFHKINLNTLRKPDGSYMLDQISVIQLTNLRYIYRRSEMASGREPGTAVFFGNPAFKKNGAPADNAASAAVVYRDLALEAGGDLQLTPLPGSEREVKSIAKKLTGKNWQTSVFSGASASEDTLKQVKSPKVLHIATHGYFLNPEAKPNAAPFAGSRTGKNPALRSMLFFAGAEDAIAGKNTGRNDGILTAFEAAVLHLDGTELVVLSACNTGLGKIQNGEGVYGLQRAFRIAGARSLIMSLWEVEDAATALLMNAFYENWTSGMPKPEAFRKAQLTLKKKYPQPFYWGSFILVNG